MYKITWMVYFRVNRSSKFKIVDSYIGLDLSFDQ